MIYRHSSIVLLMFVTSITLQGIVLADVDGTGDVPTPRKRPFDYLLERAEQERQHLVGLGIERCKQLLQSGEYDDALKLINSVLELDPGHGVAAQLKETIIRHAAIRSSLEKAKRFLDKKEFDLARRAADEVIKLDKKNIEAARLRRTAITRTEESIFKQKLHRADPANKIAKCADDNCKKLNDLISKVSTLPPDDPEAAQIYRHATELINPAMVEVLTSEVEQLVESRQWVQAAETCFKLLTFEAKVERVDGFLDQIAKEFPEIWLELATRRARGLNGPDAMRANLTLAKAQFVAGKKNEAQATIENLLKLADALKPSEAQLNRYVAALQLATRFGFQSEQRRALDAAKALVRQFRSPTNAWSRLAGICLEAGLYEDFDQLMRQTSNIDLDKVLCAANAPRTAAVCSTSYDDSSKSMVMYMAATFGDTELYEAIKKSFKRTPDHDYNRLLITVAAIRAGDTEFAASFQKKLRRQIDREWVNRYLAEEKAKAGEWVIAANLIDRVSDRDARSDGLSAVSAAAIRHDPSLASAVARWVASLENTGDQAFAFAGMAIGTAKDASVLKDEPNRKISIWGVIGTGKYYRGKGISISRAVSNTPAFSVFGKGTFYHLYVQKVGNHTVTSTTDYARELFQKKPGDQMQVSVYDSKRRQVQQVTAKLVNIEIPAKK